MKTFKQFQEGIKTKLAIGGLMALPFAMQKIKDKFDPAKKVPLGRVGEHQELSNLCAYLVSDFSSYINGEVVTIDGAEWLKGAGQFNNLEMVTKEMWDFFEMMRKKN